MRNTLISNEIEKKNRKNLHELQKNFVVFNEKNFGMIGPKGRFTNMAEKIKYNIPLYLCIRIYLIFHCCTLIFGYPS